MLVHAGGESLYFFGELRQWGGVAVRELADHGRDAIQAGQAGRAYRSIRLSSLGKTTTTFWFGSCTRFLIGKV